MKNSKKGKRMVFCGIISLQLLLCCSVSQCCCGMLCENVLETKQILERKNYGDEENRVFFFVSLFFLYRGKNEKNFFCSFCRASNHGEGASCATMCTAAKCATEARIVAAWKILGESFFGVFFLGGGGG